MKYSLTFNTKSDFHGLVSTENPNFHGNAHENSMNIFMYFYSKFIDTALVVLEAKSMAKNMPTGDVEGFTGSTSWLRKNLDSDYHKNLKIK